MNILEKIGWMIAGWLIIGSILTVIDHSYYTFKRKNKIEIDNDIV